MRIIKKHKRNLPLFGLLGVLLFTTVACKSTDGLISAAEEKEGWEMVKADKEEVPSWVIYRRKIEGTKELEYKIKGDIYAAPSICISEFKKNLYDLSKGEGKESDYEYLQYDIVTDTTNNLCVYAIHNEPFPFKDTEMSILYTFQSDTTGNAEVRWREAWNDHPRPESKKLKRVESFRGSWQFSSTSNDVYEATNSVEFDLGNFPLFLAQPMVFKFLKNGLTDMRKTYME
jgi:hypothetical protein